MNFSLSFHIGGHFARADLNRLINVVAQLLDVKVSARLLTHLAREQHGPRSFVGSNKSAGMGGRSYRIQCLGLGYREGVSPGSRASLQNEVYGVDSLTAKRLWNWSRISSESVEWEIDTERLSRRCWEYVDAFRVIRSSGLEHDNVEIDALLTAGIKRDPEAVTPSWMMVQWRIWSRSVDQVEPKEFSRAASHDQRIRTVRNPEFCCLTERSPADLERRLALAA